MSGNGVYFASGAPYDNSNTGATYIYKRSGVSWFQEAKIIAAGTSIQGRPVCLNFEGDTVAIGATGDNGDRGAVLIYKRTGASWASEAKLIPAGLAASASFGYAISLSHDGNTLIASIFPYSGASGAIYVYVRSGCCSWSIQGSAITYPSGTRLGVMYTNQAISADGNAFIATVFVSGDTADSIIYYTRTASVWSVTGNRIILPSVDLNTCSLAAITNDRIVCGYTNYDYLGQFQGANFVFNKLINNTWILEAGPLRDLRLYPSIDEIKQGVSVSITGDGSLFASTKDCFPSLTGGINMYRRQGQNWELEGPVRVGTGSVNPWCVIGRPVSLSANGTYMVASGEFDASGVGAAYVFF
jgi:hypothetical protein